VVAVSGSASAGWLQKSSDDENFREASHQPGEAAGQVAAAADGRYVGVERVFPRLRFNRPVFLTGAGDGSGRIFIVEQDGVIRVFGGNDHPEPDGPGQSSVFLDIRQKVNRRGNEEGLLGLAFHPDFADNGQFFVHYSLKSEPRGREGAPNVLARYCVDPADPDRANPDSEEVIFRQPQPYSNHNGGMIAFGPDGHLYVSLGDGGSANDPHGHGQDLSTLLGAIIRIDVNRAIGEERYAIPDDNPFVDTPRARPELWAVGLRNVWRFSFDRESGLLLAADVGQDRIEEVNVIEKGGNYGWNRFEANSDFNLDTRLVSGRHVPPVAMYGRSEGISITGGYVYRGEDYPQLRGKYFYGDYVSGNLWALSGNQSGDYTSELVRRTGRSIASFGEDDRGELYLVSFDGGIYRIVATDQPEDTFADWPRRLSETGFLSVINEQAAEAMGKLQELSRFVAEEYVPYELNAPFWSDGAGKQRFIRLPEGQRLKYTDEGTWEIPVGTVLVKQFSGSSLGRDTPFETRIIKRTEAGWQAATYVWNQALEKTGEIEAHLLPAGKQFEVYQRQGRTWQITSWHAPSSAECASCHVSTAGFVLGLNTAQLNRDVDGQNQLLRWQEQVLLELPVDFDLQQAPRYHALHDQSSTLESRVRTWLDVNCAMCHQPNGPGNANIDLRFATALPATGMVGQPPAQGDFGIADAMILAPGHPDKSLLWHRVRTLGSGRMPNIGSNRVDETAVSLIRQWIEAMP
jgi:uncharacterized repeat protein (TIGR03806 family)